MDLPKFDPVAVVERREAVLRVRSGAEVDRRSGVVAKLEMTGDEIRVKVGQDDVRDLQSSLLGKRHVLVDIALRTTVATCDPSSPIKYDAWARQLR